MNLLLHLKHPQPLQPERWRKKLRVGEAGGQTSCFDSHYGDVWSALCFLLHLSTLAALHCSASQLQSAAFISPPVLSQSFLPSFGPSFLSFLPASFPVHTGVLPGARESSHRIFYGVQLSSPPIFTSGPHLPS